MKIEYGALAQRRYGYIGHVDKTYVTFEGKNTILLRLYQKSISVVTQKLRTMTNAEKYTVLIQSCQNLFPRMVIVLRKISRQFNVFHPLASIAMRQAERLNVAVQAVEDYAKKKKLVTFNNIYVLRAMQEMEIDFNLFIVDAILVASQQAAASVTVNFDNICNVLQLLALMQQHGTFFPNSKGDKLVLFMLCKAHILQSRQKIPMHDMFSTLRARKPRNTLSCKDNKVHTLSSIGKFLAIFWRKKSGVEITGILSHVHRVQKSVLTVFCGILDNKQVCKLLRQYAQSAALKDIFTFVLDFSREMKDFSKEEVRQVACPIVADELETKILHNSVLSGENNVVHVHNEATTHTI